MTQISAGGSSAYSADQSAPSAQPTQPSTTPSVTGIPLGEVLFVDKLPAVVVSFGAQVGESVADDVATLQSQDVGVEVSLDSVDALKAGDVVSIVLDGDAGSSVPGKVASIRSDSPQPSSDAKQTGASNASSTSNSTGKSIAVVRPVEQGKMADSIGQSASVVLTRQSSNGSVLAVPTAALFDTTDGASLRTSNNGIVRVQVGISGDGYTEIKGSSPSIQEGEVVQLSAGAGGDK